MLGAVKFEIPNNVIETFSTWNVGPLKNNVIYDKLMVEALLLIFVSQEDLVRCEVDQTVRGFINGLFFLSLKFMYVETICRKYAFRPLVHILMYVLNNCFFYNYFPLSYIFISRLHGSSFSG